MSNPRILALALLAGGCTFGDVHITTGAEGEETTAPADPSTSTSSSTSGVAPSGDTCSSGPVGSGEGTGSTGSASTESSGSETAAACNPILGQASGYLACVCETSGEVIDPQECGCTVGEDGVCCEPLPCFDPCVLADKACVCLGIPGVPSLAVPPGYCAL